MKYIKHFEGNLKIGNIELLRQVKEIVEQQISFITDEGFIYDIIIDKSNYDGLDTVQISISKNWSSKDNKFKLSDIKEDVFQLYEYLRVNYPVEGVELKTQRDLVNTRYHKVTYDNKFYKDDEILNIDDIDKIAILTIHIKCLQQSTFKKEEEKKKGFIDKFKKFFK